MNRYERWPIKTDECIQAVAKLLMDVEISRDDAENELGIIHLSAVGCIIGPQPEGSLKYWWPVPHGAVAKFVEEHWQEILDATYGTSEGLDMPKKIAKQDV